MTRTDIMEGINFLLSHFEGDNALWPRLISVKDESNIPVDCDCKKCEDANCAECIANGKIKLKGPRFHPLWKQASKKMLDKFHDAKLLDCRINPYPDFVDGYYKSDARECITTHANGVTPNFLFVDLDMGAFSKTLDAFRSEYDALNYALHFVLDNIDEKFHGSFCPTVIWTGNGYHIYLPVQLSGPSWCLGHTDAFMALSKTPDRDFLRWVEYYLSNGLADPEHFKTSSFKNMWLRVPGSFNSKNGCPVTILQRWDGNRPYINWILKDFYDYLLDKKHPNSLNHLSRLGGFRQNGSL